ncbi:MAG: sulfur oxidation c-type cytochrome SoxA [Thiotrichales bacterium]
MTKLKTIALALGAAIAVNAQAQDASVAEYREMLSDPFANPGLLVIDRGEELFKSPRGPKYVSLEKCDLGKGPGQLKGAYAELPRYFKDTDRVQDLESRLVTCMTTLQGFDEGAIKKKLYADQRKNEANTDLEAIATYVAAQSADMPIKHSVAHPKEKEAAEVGEAYFWHRHGPLDFSCATCHAESGKRIRLQDLGNVYNPKEIQATMTTWPTYRVSHNVVRNLQHRMWDCHWQMRTPDVDYGSPASVALISFLMKQADGGILSIPGMKR